MPCINKLIFRAKLKHIFGHIIISIISIIIFISILFYFFYLFIYFFIFLQFYIM